MSRFTTDTHKLTLPASEDFIIVKTLPYEEFMSFASQETEGVDAVEKLKKQADKNITFLTKSLISWSFKSNDGVEVPCDEPHIKDLDVKTILECVAELQTLYTPDIKKKPQLPSA